MEFCADVTKVCDYLKVDVEEFNNLTVAQIEKVKAEIKMAEIEARRNDKELMEDYRFFFKEYDLFVKYFGKSLTDKYLPIIPLENLVEKLHVKRGEQVRERNARLVGQESWSFPVRRGPGSRSGRTEYLPADVYDISSEYQGLKHRKIIQAIFNELYPWLDEFELSIYELRTRDSINEFYVSTDGEFPLYVPYTSFVEGDIDGILKRNEDYLGWYNRFSSKGRTSYEDLINTPTVKKFLDLVASNNK